MSWAGGKEGGQATVEWIGLVLGIALALAALAAGGREAVRGESATALGRAVAKRITCAARDACGVGSAAGAGGGDRRDGAPGGSLRAPRLPRGLPPSTAADVSRLLPGAARLASRAWIVCLGYRRWRYDVDHPRTPGQAVPVGDTLEIVNECVNPWSFFFG
jgi:hypothetical protein